MHSITSLNILFIAAEAEPFVKVGGLGDYAGSLPHAILNIDSSLFQGKRLDLRMAIPFHSSILKENFDIQSFMQVKIQSKGKPISFEIFSTKINNLIIYLIRPSDNIFTEDPIYSPDASMNFLKYSLFSIGCVELVKQLNWQVDILHANDWHTALAIVAIKQKEKNNPIFDKIKTVLTIHNMGYMGSSQNKILDRFNIKPVLDPELPKWAVDQPLPMGLVLSDLIIAVSPNYSKEIRTAQFGYGLENLLKTRKKSITGILNGIDYQKWNPETDRSLFENYSIQTIDLRKNNKSSLQKRLKLEQKEYLPLIAIISRLDYQKGIDIALLSLTKLMHLPWQLVILGTGDHKLVNDCLEIANNNSGRISSILRYDDGLARHIYSAADIVLIPSRYEPCGTTQMIAMRYGCLPIARATGGLKDSIGHLKEGFLFEKPTSKSLSIALTEAILLYKNKPTQWRKMQKNAMQKDFSWNNSAKEYLNNYLRLLS